MSHPGRGHGSKQRAPSRALESVGEGIFYFATCKSRGGEGRHTQIPRLPRQNPRKMSQHVTQGQGLVTRASSDRQGQRRVTRISVDLQPVPPAALGSSPPFARREMWGLWRVVKDFPRRADSGCIPKTWQIRQTYYAIFDEAVEPRSNRPKRVRDALVTL